MGVIKLGTAKILDDALVKRALSQKPRDYMGASGLGTECSRELWYSYHEPLPIDDPRLQRIFDLGNAIEDLVIQWLREAGFTVYTEDENGEQFGFIDEEVAGHIDGVILGIPESTKPHLLEVKSANAKRFKQFIEKGYKSDKKYWTQVHTYMKEMSLEKCLVVVVNKDNCDLYFERIDLDTKYADRQILRGKEIAKLKNDIPVRQYQSPTFYKCKWCNYRDKCWEARE